MLVTLRLKIVEVVKRNREGVHEGKKVVGPFEAFSQTGAQSGHSHGTLLYIEEWECAHHGMVGSDSKGIWLFPSQPGLSKGEGIILKLSPVGLNAQLKTLAITHRKRLPGLEIGNVANGEVVEYQADRTDKAVESSPSPRELYLIAGPFNQTVFDVDGAVGHIWHGVDSDLFGIEVAQL